MPALAGDGRMINFRYHIVSLMAVFLALSVGIVIGVILRPSVDEGLAQQAAQDRKQVQDLRAELGRRNALDDYREAYAARAGSVVLDNVLNGERVALIAMPDAPNPVVESLAAAVEDAGGTVTATAKVNKNVFDTDRAQQVNEALADFAGTLQFSDSMSTSTRAGLAVGRALLGKEAGNADAVAGAVSKALADGGLVSIDGDGVEQARLAIVVTAEATEPRPAAELSLSHADFDIALKSYALGVVVSGPNSADIEGTDVLAVRTTTTTADILSTVDVADLTSGVTTTVLAGKEQLLGREGHYGALTGSSAPAPVLPVR
jgi:Copper transport outer membrane protein, MctB